MAYPERKPIYEVYEKIVKAIVDQKLYKEYASSEIEALNRDLLQNFNQIKEKLLTEKFKQGK